MNKIPEARFFTGLYDTDSPSDWTSLRAYLGYRLFLAGVMLLFFFVIQRGPLGTFSPWLFGVVSLAYSGVTLASLVFSLNRERHYQAQVLLAVMLDIAFITVLMYASGGVQSGLGILIAISIALGAISLQGRTALLLAAIGSLAMIAEELFAHLDRSFENTAYAQAGMLGITFFALAALAHKLAMRAKQSEELASQRSIDLASMEQLNDYVIQQLQAGIVVIDEDQRVQVMNEAAWVLLGMPQAMRHHLLEEVSPTLADEYQEWQHNPQTAAMPFRASRGGRDLRAEFNKLGEQGEQGTLIVLEDTATLTAQAQQMKLASLGRLTAGIAHEIRNPLGAISHAAQLLGESPELNSSDQRMTEIIQQNSLRVNEVIQNILKLSRQDNPKPKPLMLGDWLRELAGDIRQSLKLRQPQLHVQIEPEGTTVFADAGQLRQVIEVLCDNAMRHFNGEADQLQIKLLAGITPESGGPFIEVQDNGPGISQKAASQLFEPFFTTRNEGTGLGLYIARQLSEANRIRLEYQALPGGSCFRLSFPNPKRPKAQ